MQLEALNCICKMNQSSTFSINSLEDSDGESYLGDAYAFDRSKWVEDIYKTDIIQCIVLSTFSINLLELQRIMPCIFDKNSKTPALILHGDKAIMLESERITENYKKVSRHQLVFRKQKRKGKDFEAPESQEYDFINEDDNTFFGTKLIHVVVIQNCVNLVVVSPLW